VVLIVLSIVPIIMGIYHISFERRRWAESMFSGGGGGGSVEDDDDSPIELGLNN
jgi:hypothetical protein